MSRIPGEKTPLRAEAEAQLAKVAPPKVPVRSDKELLHELHVHQIKLEMQNEELRRMQVALEESRDRYADLYELAPVGYLTLTETGLIAEINLTGTALLGKERQHLVQRRFAGFVAAGDNDRWHRFFLSVLQHDDRQSCELDMQRGDGGSFSALLDCIRTEKVGEARRVRIILNDISKRKQDEDALKKSSEEIADLYNHAPCGYHSIDKDGIIRQINDTELKWLGYTRDEVVGEMKVTDLLTSTSLKFFREYFPRFMMQGFVEDMELEMIRKNGTVFTALVNATAIYDPAGHYVMSRSTVVDITQRKRLERKLMEHRSEMNELQKLQIAAQTAAAIAHELNQPLLAIASYSRAAHMMLQAEKPDLDKVRHALEANEQQAHRAGKSIRELLEFLSIKEFPTGAFDLNMEIRDAIDTARSEHGLKFHSRLQLQMDLAPVRANRTHVQKVLLNLLHNGIEAMQEAGVLLPSITVAVRTMKDSGLAQVTIQDNGPGIKDEDFQRMFEPFFTTKAEGIGMGLSISRSLIEANGGQLWIDPQERPGATFHFTLPWAT